MVMIMKMTMTIMIMMIIIVILSLTLSKYFNKISHKLKKFRCKSRKSCLSHHSREAQQHIKY